MRVVLHLREAGVINLERSHPGQRQIQQNGKHHPNDAAVTDDGNALPRVIAHNLPQGRLDARAE